MLQPILSYKLVVKYIYTTEDERSRVICHRDGNFTHGSRYLWIPYPMGTGVGVTFYPWARLPGTRRRYGQHVGFIFDLWVTHAQPDTYVLVNFDSFINSYTISLGSFVMLTDTKL